jgi:hypothetical protein
MVGGDGGSEVQQFGDGDSVFVPSKHSAGSIAVLGEPGWWDGEFGQTLGQGLHLLSTLCA